MAVLCFGRVPREVVAWACLNSRARNHNGMNLLSVALSARVRCGEHFLCHVRPCSAGSAILSTVKPCSLTISPCHPSETCTLATQKDANAAPLACWTFAECHGVSCAAGRDSSDGTARAGRGTVWCDGFVLFKRGRGEFMGVWVLEVQRRWKFAWSIGRFWRDGECAIERLKCSVFTRA